MYKCNHCNITFKNKDDEGILTFRGKMYCKRCEEPVEEIPDIHTANTFGQGAQATLISNSDNRITTNNYYGGEMVDEQLDTRYGPCRKSEVRLCKKCRQWVPLMYFNAEQGICDNCIEHEGIQAYEEGKTFFEMELFDEALIDFRKFEPVCNNPKELAILQYYIARCFYEKKQWKDAFKYFVKSREQVPDSLYYMGLCFYNGYGITKDEKRAIDYIQIAAQRRSLLATEFLTTREKKKKQEDEERKRKEIEKKEKINALLSKADEAFDNKSYAQVIDFFMDAEKVGHTFSACEFNEIGYCYYCEEKYTSAIDFFKKAAALGNESAMFNIGYCFEYGLGVNEDLKETIKWYTKAANLGGVGSQYRLGLIYYHSDEVGNIKEHITHGRWVHYDEIKNYFPIPYNKEEAKKWFRMAAEQGHPQAQCELGSLLSYDENKKEESFKWLLKAAENGIRYAQWLTAKNYAEGRGVHVDSSAALKWYKKSAEQKDSYAMYMVGNYYEHGWGTAKDVFEAVKWYKKSAETGDNSGTYALGRCYEFGIGISRNIAEAVRWYRSSKLPDADNALKRLGYSK